MTNVSVKVFNRTGQLVGPFDLPRDGVHVNPPFQGSRVGVEREPGDLPVHASVDPIDRVVHLGK